MHTITNRNKQRSNVNIKHNFLINSPKATMNYFPSKYKPNLSKLQVPCKLGGLAFMLKVTQCRTSQLGSSHKDGASSADNPFK